MLHPRPGWTHIPALHLPRLARRIDSVLLGPGAVLVFGRSAAIAEAAALDLADFHAGCHDAPVLPIHLVQGERVQAQHPLPLPGAARPMACTRLLLPILLDQLDRFPRLPTLDPATWAAAPYHPVPALLQAAATLYAHHGDARLQLTTSPETDLARTRAAIAALLQPPGPSHRIVFVTGAPGAGKTLIGLDTAFDPARQAAFLTGNPALLHILRAALARDAVARGLPGRAARQRIDAVIQPLHAFRDHHAASPHPPPDHLLVIDEAQRCWTEAYATRKTTNRPHPLHASEPALILDAMARRPQAAILCLLGGGQEIHAGEGGLASWGDALATRPLWQVHAPPAPLGPDPRQRLPALPDIRHHPALHLGRSIRQFRAPTLASWADAVLANQPTTARSLAPALPLHLTRSRAALQEALRGRRRAATAATTGLLASSGARRLRAEGLGGLLWHQDEDAVASWFLDPWPDIRSADALELAATEFGVQGLELDHAGLCWDADLVRTAGAWQARSFRATAWTVPRTPDALSNRLNAYRVLLTRARRSLVIWVPQGDARDPTRDPAHYDAIATYLAECGATTLDPARAMPDHPPTPEPRLL